MEIDICEAELIITALDCFHQVAAGNLLFLLQYPTSYWDCASLRETTQWSMRQHLKIIQRYLYPHPDAEIAATLKALISHEVTAVPTFHLRLGNKNSEILLAALNLYSDLIAGNLNFLPEFLRQQFDLTAPSQLAVIEHHTQIIGTLYPRETITKSAPRIKDRQADLLRLISYFEKQVLNVQL